MINYYQDWLEDALQSGADNVIVDTGYQVVMEDLSEMFKIELSFEEALEMEQKTDIVAICKKNGYEFEVGGFYAFCYKQKNKE